MRGIRTQAMKKAKRTGILLTAVLALALTAMPARQVRADYIDLDTDMSLVVTPAEKAEELKEAGLVVDLYQVATAEEVKGYDTYQFAATSDFASLAEDVRNPDVTNDDWKNIAQKAADLVFREGSTVVPASGLTGKSPKFDDESGDDSAIDLPSGGLYLVVARNSSATEKSSYAKKDKDGLWTTITSGKKLTFTIFPQLVAVPGKPQYDSNNTADPESWMYKVPMTLKIAWEEREAEMVIVKTLESYETKDPATVIFQIEASLGEDSILSTVEEIVFDAPGRKTLPIKGLPVGAKVTVTEIYEGANYKLSTGFEATQTVTLAANEIAQVEFKDEYDDTYHGGGSVKNEFTKTTTDKGNGVYDPTAKIKDKDQLEADKAAK